VDFSFYLQLIGLSIKVLCGNKSDLEQQREVSTEEGRDLADSFGIPFFETSAKTGSFVKEAYEKLVLEIPEYRSTHKVSFSNVQVYMQGV
jgi:GTPase SAR1 family protein